MATGGSQGGIQRGRDAELNHGPATQQRGRIRFEARRGRGKWLWSDEGQEEIRLSRANAL